MIESATHPLEFVVCNATHILVCVLDDAHHPFRSLPFIQVGCKSVTKSFYGWLSFEGRQVSPKHQFDCADNSVHVRADSKEGLDSQLLEKSVSLRISSAHKHNHFMI